MKEKIIALLSKYPVLATAQPAQLARLGITPEAMAEAKAAIEAKLADVAPGQTAAANYGSLAWNIVGKQAIRKWHSTLAPLTGAFSTDISGDTVLADDPDVHPKITVNVVDVDADSAVINPTNLDALDGGSSTGVEVSLDIIAAGCKVPASAIMDGHRADEMVLACVETCRRKAMAYVLGKLVEAGVTDTDGEAVSAPGELTVPAVGSGWGAGYVNRNLSEAIDAEGVCLLVDRPHYAGLKPEDNDSLSLNKLDVEGVHKVSDLAPLGEGVVGLLAAKNCMAVGMRAPFMWSEAYSAVVQLTDGETQLPLTMVQYFKPGEMQLRIAVLTAVGARRVNGAGAILLKDGAAAAEASAAAAEE
ncbi:MAG: hypothetical protein IJA81_09200 [Akkermansia sp.]|nr:hypothetical protein [Akkermansia sp.]